MNTFQFTGEWEFKLIFAGFAGFQQSDGTLSVRIYDLRNDDPDPLPQQVAAINYLLENSTRVADEICVHVFNEYPSLLKIYDELPPVSTPEDIKKYIRVNHVSISTRFKGEMAYMDFSAHCDWDEEHGLGIGMHRSEVIYMGGTGDGYHMEEDDASKELNTYIKKKPQLYVPHPKYGKLKPSHESQNLYYELALIREGYNEEFKALILTGQREVNFINPKWGFTGSFIAWAIQYNNKELIAFLVERNARLDYMLHEVGKDKEKIEWLLNHGVSINERNRSGHVLLREQLFNLRGVLMNQEQQRASQPNAKDEDYYTNAVKSDMDYIQWLIGKGADPTLIDMNSVLNFWGRDHDNERIKRILLQSIQPVSSQQSTSPGIKTKPWWKFWE